MVRLLTRRIFEAVPVLFMVSIVVFGLLLLIPGDPVLALLGPAAQVDQEQVEVMRHEMNLDQPIPVQYLSWLGRTLSGDLGRSISSKQPVAQSLLKRLPVSAELAVFSTFIALAIAVPLGILAATRANTLWDLLASFISVLGLAIPNFWLAILLILLFGVHWKLLPASGYVSFFEDPIQAFRHLLLPAIALGASGAGSLMRQIRSSLLEVLREDYIRTAHAKGLSGKVVLRRHAMRNALIPVITVLGIQFGRLLGGSLIVESIFLVPGVGSLLINAIFTRDFPVVQAGALTIAFIVILINLIVDVLYDCIDPRIRQQ